MAWAALTQHRPPLGNFYLIYQDGGPKRKFRNLSTSNPAVAQAELAKARAELSGRPWSNGRRQWQRVEWDKDWAELAGLHGKTRVSQQRYAFAIRAMQALSDDSRWAWILKPKPKVTVLSALGTITVDEILQLTADEICEGRLSSKAACAVVHSLMARHSRSRSSTLPDRIRRAIQYHVTLHPETRPGEIALQLRAIACDYEPSA